MLSPTKLGILFLFVAAFSGSSLGVVPGADKSEETYAVIVHPKNPVHFEDEEAARRSVRKLFLRTSSQWSSKLEAKPFMAREGEPAHGALVSKVLHMSQGEIARHWITMKNTEGIAPPREISGGRMMRKYVSRFEGALGVVPFEEGLDQGPDAVRVLFLFGVEAK